MEHTLLYHENMSMAFHIHLNEKSYLIHNIYVYDDDGNIITSFDYFYADVFTFREQTNMRRKINFERHENFVIKWKGEMGVDLYIYYKNIDMVCTGDFVENKYSYDNPHYVVNSYKYRKYLILDNYRKVSYIHKEFKKDLGKRKRRLVYLLEDLVIRKFLKYRNYSFGSFEPMDTDELNKILNKISKLNDRINRENEKLILREMINR